MTRWFHLSCVHCAKTVLVPTAIAVRVADGLSFVLCIPCADEYEAMTGHEPIAEVRQAS